MMTQTSCEAVLRFVCSQPAPIECRSAGLAASFLGGQAMGTDLGTGRTEIDPNKSVGAKQAGQLNVAHLEA